MARPLYSAKNILGSAAAISFVDIVGNPVDPMPGGFDWKNTVDGFPGTVARPATNLRGTLVFGPIFNEQPITCVALIRHNFPPDASILWRGSFNGTSWQTIFNLSPYLVHPSFVVTFPEASYTQYGLLVSTLGTYVDPWQVGEVWAGRHTVFSQDLDWGFREGEEFRSVGVMTEAGVPIDYHQSSNRTLTGQAGSGLTPAERDEYAAFLRAVRGSVSPFIWCPDSASPACYLAKSRISRYDARYQSPGRWADIDLDVFEIPAGREGR